MKKIVLLVLCTILCMTLGDRCYAQSGMCDERVTKIDNESFMGDGVEKDEVYDPKQPNCILDRDDFESDQIYKEYLKKYKINNVAIENEKGMSVTNSSKAMLVTLVTPDLTYKFKLSKPNAIQSYCVNGNNIYVSQKFDTGITFNGASHPGNNVLISKCYLDSDGFYKVQSSMLLEGAGHGQSLEVYNHTYNGVTHTYLLVSCGYYRPSGETYYWSTQIGRIEFEENSVKSNSELKRLTYLNYSNKTATSFGATKRIDFALSSDKNYLLIWKRSQANVDEFSGYRFNTINACFDATSATSISFKSNTQLKNACTFTFQEPQNMPSSMQGLELSNLSNNLHSIYITSGNESSSESGFSNYIYRFNSAGVYKATVKINDTGLWSAYNSSNTYNAVAEIEGCKISGDNLQFVLRDTNSSHGQYQIIASLNKSWLQ